MLSKKPLLISLKLLSAVLLAALTGVFIFLASQRRLPFLSDEEQSYDNVIFSSDEPLDSSEQEISDDVSSEESEVPDASGIITDAAFADAIVSFKVSQPLRPVYDVYDESRHSLVLLDTTAFAGLSDGAFLSMGFIHTTVDGTTRIYSPDGRDITAAASGLTLTTLRDLDGNPLFINENGSYFILGEDGNFSASDYNHKEDKRGFDCEIPRYLGVQDENIYRYTQNGQYGYRTKGYAVIVPMFREAFAFSPQGVGCVLQKYGTTEYLVFYNSKAVTVNMDYFPPESRGESALGYFYFDDGLVRVRAKADGGYKELLMDTAGKIVTLPSDYSIVSYTDSRILLEKNGRYGFMSSRLEWVTLPEYTLARPFYEGLAVVAGQNGKQGVIDRDGNTVIPMVFDYITNCSDGIILAHENDNGWFVFAKTAAPSISE